MWNLFLSCFGTILYFLHKITLRIYFFHNKLIINELLFIFMNASGLARYSIYIMWVQLITKKYHKMTKMEKNATLFDAFDAIEKACSANEITPEELISYYATMMEIRARNNAKKG